MSEERGNKEVGFLYSALAAAWGVGTALLLLWLGVCHWHLSRLRREARPVTSGPAAETLSALTPRPPRLLCHPSVQSPFLAGLRHPAIFLPAAYEAEFDPTTLRAILAHELAHLARRDNAWTLAARLLCALLWPQPLLWLLCRRLEQTSEEACDQAVLAQDCPPRAYADCLLTLAERHPLPRRERTLGAGVAPFRSSLGQRIGRILDKGTHTMSTVSTRLRLTVAALAVAAVLGAAFLVSSAPAQSPGQALIIATPEQQRFKAMQLQDMGNLKQIGLALTQYAQDHDEHFPSATHWMDALSPYLKDKTVFFDPFQPGMRRYGYAFNRNCSGKSLAAFLAPAETVAVFDSTLGTRNASDTGQSPHMIKQPSISLLGSAYAFVDGHVKWFRQGIRPSFLLKGGRPTASGMVMAETTRALRQVEWQRLSENVRSTGTTPTGSEALNQARFLAGLTPVQGPGVVVTLNDSHKSLPKMPSSIAPPNIIHDTDINQVVNELKAAGAEAIAINDQRLVATSSIRCMGPTVFVNYTPQVPPYVIKAIGSSKAMTTAMNIPGGVASQIKNFDPAMFSVKEAGTLTLPAYSAIGEPRYAKPVSAASANDARKRMVEAASSQSLAQQRERLQAQMIALNTEDAFLTTRLQMMQAQAQQAVKKPLYPGANTRNMIHTQRQDLVSQIARAQADLAQKKATSAPQSPALLRAQVKLQGLEYAYRQLPIWEKQEFVREVHQDIRQRTASLNAFAHIHKAMSSQLDSVRLQHLQVQAEIADLDARITRRNRLAPGR